MRPLPRFAIFFAACTALSSPSFATGQEDAIYAIEFGTREIVPSTPSIGAFRTAFGDKWIAGGGLSANGRPVDLRTAQPTDEAVLLTRSGEGWQKRPLALPEPVAWPAVAVADGSLLVVGGLRDDGLSSRVSRWTWTEDRWTAVDLAELPYPMALAGAAVMDNALHVAGGYTTGETASALLRLDLGDPGAEWEILPIDGAPENWFQPSLVVRRDEVAIRDALYLLGGWTAADPTSTEWQPVNSVLKFLPKGPLDEQLSTCLSSPANALLLEADGLGPSHILAVSTAKETIGHPLFRQAQPAERETRFLRYHLFTDTWAPFSGVFGQEVTSLHWSGKKELLLSIRQADRGELLTTATITAVERHFSFLDYLVMVLYMLGLVAIGKYFASREKGTEDFFLGGRRVPWWAAGLSIYATGTSAISFMAIPAKTYSTDWLYFIGMSIFPFFTVTIAAFVFVPLLRRLEITTVMEYFEMRFGRPIRLLMSAITVLGQVAGRMSITLLLPSIALTAVTGMNLYVCILVMGVLATIYTAVGGINAVIWTDVLQVAVLFGGALLSFFLIAFKVEGGIGSMMTLAVEDNKFNLLDMSWDFTTATIWIMFLWAVSDVFGKGLGQEGLQRAFSTKGVREARRSMITCAVVALPAGFLFYGIGTALYSFYHAQPELLNPTLQTDAVFPLFIAQQLPAGIAGLVISGLFAASMSTLDTAMNTSATIVTRDFYSIWKKDTADEKQLLLAKGVTIVCGAIGTGTALYMASFENLGSLWDMFSILLGVIGGGLGGVGVLALCTTRANTWGTLAGALVTAVCIVLIKQHTPVHFFIYGTISMAIGSVTGYLFSLLIPCDKDKDLTGLTLWTPARDRPAD